MRSYSLAQVEPALAVRAAHADALRRRDGRQLGFRKTGGGPGLRDTRPGVACPRPDRNHAASTDVCGGNARKLRRPRMGLPRNRFHAYFSRCALAGCTVTRPRSGLFALPWTISTSCIGTLLQPPHYRRLGAFRTEAPSWSHARRRAHPLVRLSDHDNMPQVSALATRAGALLPGWRQLRLAWEDDLDDAPLRKNLDQLVAIAAE
jgi:hypothetical protein